MLKHVFILGLAGLFAACQPSARHSLSLVAAPSSSDTNPPVCDCCVFDEKTSVTWQARVAPDTAQGQPLQISGTVYESDGKTPAANVLMYFYHTNAQGYYAKIGLEKRTSHAWWHGYCRGWLKTDANGRYQINTIRPAPYPRRTIPAHIHFYVKAPSQRSCYYLSDFVFQDDTLLTESYWYQLEQSEGFPRYGGVALVNRNGLLVGRRDIQLLPRFDRVPTQSGLPVGADCPAFDPYHVWGPDRNKRTCPMCAYGLGEGVMIWTRSPASDTLRKTARFWEQQLRQRGSRPLNAFIIYTNPDHKSDQQVRHLLEMFATSAGLQEVAVLYVRSPDEKSTAFLYAINPSVTTTVLLYKRRKVVGKQIDPSGSTASLAQQVQWLN
jgi:protocatechuate 3,4-dioxygenase, beta subunit